LRWARRGALDELALDDDGNIHMVLTEKNEDGTVLLTNKD
jgi:hypothetical protein